MLVDRVVEGAPTGPFVRLAADGPVRVITLDRPERHNALVPDLVDGLRAAVGAVRADPAARAVVLTGEGRNFSTGGDVAGFASRSGVALAEYARRLVGGLNATMLDLITLDVPVVTAVRGAVTGGSLGLVLASDVVLAGRDATFTPYYVDVGFSPDGGWTALLPDLVGRSRALAVQLGNDTVDADSARDWGLVTEIVSGDVQQAALERAHQYAGRRTAAVRRTKRLLWGDTTGIAVRLQVELESFVEEIVTPEAAAGMTAFLDPGRERPGP